MKKDYQVRVEWEGNGETECFSFSSISKAKKFYTGQLAAARELCPDDDVHLELIEVLEQESVEPEPEFVEEG